MTDREKLNQEIGRLKMQRMRIDAQIEGIEHALKILGEAPAPSRNGASTPRTSGKRAPRGESEKKVVAFLAAGPKRLREIAKGTGIKYTTVADIVHRLAAAGKVAKLGDRSWELLPVTSDAQAT